jgi:hypothetical protein
MLSLRDDTLFYLPKMEYIDEIIEKFQQQEMDLEVEGEVPGFLGVHIDKNVAKGMISKNEEGEEPDGSFNYASVIGMLQYLQNHSRPDITFAVSQCARFIHQPKRSHELAMMRIGQYLKGTIDKGLVFVPTGKLQIDCYVNADFAGMWPHEDRDDHCKCGYVICLLNCPVVWGSKLLGEISTSMMEAEYNALSMSMREMLPFKHLVEAVSLIVGYDKNEITTFKTTVLEDNMGALTLAQMEPGRVTPRSKHYGVKMHWFWSKLT